MDATHGGERAAVRRVLPAILPENYRLATWPALQMSRMAHGTMITSQITAPPHANGSAIPPTTMTAKGTSTANVAASRPTGPNVVGVFPQRVRRGAGGGRALAAGGVQARPGTAGAAAVRVAGAKH